MTQPLERTPAVVRRLRPAGYAVVRVGDGSFLLHRRACAVAVLLAAVLAVTAVVSLCVGESFVSPTEVVHVLLGQPSPDELVVGTLRLPRLVTGLLVGAAFGVSGALIQAVARNSLASPDVIGVTHGAGAATVTAMTFGLTSYTVLPYVSVAGGLAAAALVYVFAWRGGLHATRFVLVGIGVSIALGSLTRLFLTKGDYLVAQQAKVWLTGSLNGRGYDQAAPSPWSSRCWSRCCCGRRTPSAWCPWTTARRPRWGCGSVPSGWGSPRSASCWRPWPPAPPVRSTSWRCSPHRSPTG